MDLKELEVLGASLESHWYYVAKGRAMRALLANTRVDEVLDVGAGSGIFSRQLLGAGICQRAVCVDPAYTDEFLQQQNSDNISYRRELPQASQKLVLMMDVLEHVDDDAALLRQYTEHLDEDGRVLISVPAFPQLWSGHDEFLEHRRRYTHESLLETVDRAGLQATDYRYFFGLLFPAVALIRRLANQRLKTGKLQARSELKNYARPVQTALVLLHDFERNTLFRFNRKAGLTLFCAARRR